jgi:hypothetical protein
MSNISFNNISILLEHPPFSSHDKRIGRQRCDTTIDAPPLMQI